jgi:hypothetical protein
MPILTVEKITLPPDRVDQEPIGRAVFTEDRVALLAMKMSSYDRLAWSSNALGMNDAHSRIVHGFSIPVHFTLGHPSYNFLILMMKISIKLLRRILLILIPALGAGTMLRAADILPLDGPWRFHRDETKVGETQKWFSHALPPPSDGPAEIHLPGSTDEAKAGLPNPKPPTLAGLYRPNIYEGTAWYQRDIDIPETWGGKRVTLRLERVHWVSRVWVDDHFIGTQDSLCTPQVYNLGSGLTAGKHRLTLCIDNTRKIDLGLFASINYEGTQTNWNGVVGKMELTASPPVSIADVQVYPDLDRKLVAVKVTVNNTTGSAAQGTIQLDAADRQSKAAVGTKSFPFQAEPGQSTVSEELPLSPKVRLWDEFSPALQVLKVQLSSGSSTDQHQVVFGMRKFAAAGTQFTMNNRPLFLRGTLECCVFPLTGYPPTDVPAWQRIFRIMKSYGLNYIRFHSWCPPDAAFTAADLEGIMVQAEGPQANVDTGTVPERDAFVRAELKRIVDVYGNHPSFCLLTPGNEFGGSREVLTDWVDMLRNEDPRHLYSSPTSTEVLTENRQFTISADGRGVNGPGTLGDARGVVPNDQRPHLGHEVGQWTFYPDFNEIREYTGVLQAKNFEIIRAQLQAKGMLDLAPKIYRADGKQAVLLYKEEIENLRRTLSYAGFALLDLHDYPGQGTALIGPLNAFWESKGFITPAEHTRYDGPTVPLLRLPKRTYTVGENFQAAAEVSHFGPSDLPNAQPEWRITNGHGHAVAEGTLPALDLPTGKLTPIGTISTSLARAAAPAKLTVTVSLKGTEFRNSWDIWVYPDYAPITPPADVLVTDAWNDAVQSALSNGRKVVLFPSRTIPAATLKGSFLPVFWSPIWFVMCGGQDPDPGTMSILCDPRHPALALFPTEFYSNWQWWDLLNNSTTLDLDGTPADFRPIVQVTDNFSRQKKLGNLFEARVGKGRLLVCTIDLQKDLAHRAVAAQLLRSLYAYTGTDAFQPASELTMTALDRVLETSSNHLAKIGAKVIGCDSEAEGYPASNAIDDDLNTIWHTVWQPTAAPLPHFLTIDMGTTLQIKGVTYLARQDNANARVGDCEVYLSKDFSNWGEPVAIAKLSNTADLQTILFKAPASGRYLKFLVKSAIAPQPIIAVADFDVIEDR